MTEPHAVRGGNGQRHDRIPVPQGRDFAVHENMVDGRFTEPQITVGQKMLSAVAGSILTSLIVTPLDVVRVRLQSQQSPSQQPLKGNPNFPAPSFANLPRNLGVTACCREVFWVTNNTPYCVVDADIMASANSNVAEVCAVEETQRRAFTSTFDGLRKIARNEGLTTLWRGLSPTLVMAVPGNVIYFAGYDWLRTSRRSPLHNRVPETYSPLVAGSTARVLAALCVSPIELFRTRMQASQGSSAAQNFKNTLGGVREMVSSQGYRALWRGLTLTLWRDVPFSALYWWGYELTRNGLLELRDRRSSEGSTGAGLFALARGESRSKQDHATTLIDSFTAGAVSGGIASVITTPFDVGKTRQQVFKQSGDSSTVPGSAGEARVQRSMMRLLVQIFKDEGVAGLFRGWIPRTLKVAPACAIMISSYEMGKKMAQRRLKDVES